MHWKLTSLCFLADFPWNADYFCDRNPSLFAKRITEVIVSGMEMYILSLKLNLPNLGLTQPVLMLYMIERLPTKGT